MARNSLSGGFFVGIVEKKYRKMIIIAHIAEHSMEERIVLVI